MVAFHKQLGLHLKVASADIARIVTMADFCCSALPTHRGNLLQPGFLRTRYMDALLPLHDDGCKGFQAFLIRGVVHIYSPPTTPKRIQPVPLHAFWHNYNENHADAHGKRGHVFRSKLAPHFPQPGFVCIMIMHI